MMHLGFRNMRPHLLLLLLPSCQAAPTEVPTSFDQRFTGRTLAVHYGHANGAWPLDAGLLPATDPRFVPGGERLQDWEFRVEPHWAGSRTQLVEADDTGKYRVEVREIATRTVLYSRGFCSIYGEWETTPEARSTGKSFEECVRVPEPREPCLLTIQRRGDDGIFYDVGCQDIGPNQGILPSDPPRRPAEVVCLIENGDPATHVDLLVAADGYSREQREEFLADARRLVDVLFQTEPFRRRKTDFNVRTLFLPTPFNTSGIGNLRANIGRDTNFGMSYNAFGSDRYVLAMDDRALREACAQAPYDALILLFNEQKYGGGGIYNLWATCAADTEPAPYVFVHEFGHSFAGLADEYYSSQVAYEEFTKPGVEPWEPNVTALLDPAKLKWRDLVEPTTPLPTPWGQARFDELDLAYQARRAQMLAAKASEAEMEALFREVKGTTGPLLAAEPHAGKVGAFEGACYQAKGLYRPSADCIMFTRNPTAFCKVCERAIERTIDSYVK